MLTKPALSGTARALAALEGPLPTLAANIRSREAAQAMVDDAEMAVLEEVMARIGPVIGHLSVPIRCYSVRQVDDRVPEVNRYFPRRGVVLAGDGPKHVRARHRDAMCGTIGGDALVLWDDGSLGRITYTGSWTCWSDGEDLMTATAVPIGMRQALQEYEFDACLDALLKAVTAAADGMEDSAAEVGALRQRAVALHRVIAALREG